MPTYKNNTKEPVLIGKDDVIPPGGIVEKLSYLAKPIEGIEKIGDKPMHNQTVFSGKFTANEVVEVPQGLTRYTIHLYAEKGEPVIYWNSKENKPHLSLYEGAKWNTRCYERLIDRVIIEPGECGRVWMNIEIL